MKQHGVYGLVAVHVSYMTAVHDDRRHLETVAHLAACTPALEGEHGRVFRVVWSRSFRGHLVGPSVLPLRRADRSNDPVVGSKAMGAGMSRAVIKREALCWAGGGGGGGRGRARAPGGRGGGDR